jgi:hypothetical protein
MTDSQRDFGAFLTPEGIFERFISPRLEGRGEDFLWVDMYAGQGNLVLPLLDRVPESERDAFFSDHILLFDIQPQMVRDCRRRAVERGVDPALARKNIQRADSLSSTPAEVLRSPLPVWHITNPPYIYAGHIMKGGELGGLEAYLRGPNEGYQDLYQVALMNDLRAGVERMTYILPTNFLFGESCSNKVREDFLPHYEVEWAWIFEAPIFDDTGVNVCICSFSRRRRRSLRDVTFPAQKLSAGGSVTAKTYRLRAGRSFRAGARFDDFAEEYRCREPLDFSFHLTAEYVGRHPGPFEVEVVNASDWKGGYGREVIALDGEARDRVEGNLLWLRTVDTGSEGGRAGLRLIEETFGEGTAGIYAPEGATRTQPIQVFSEPALPEGDQALLRCYFNGALEALRMELEDDFLTTYRYNTGGSPRKYLGLSQARKLLETFPGHLAAPSAKRRLREAARAGDLEALEVALAPFSDREIKITDYLSGG